MAPVAFILTERQSTIIHYNLFSWNNHSNKLYIDQPVQVGFSYPDLVPAYLNDDEGAIVELKDGEECPDDAEICGEFSKPDASTTASSTSAAAPNFYITLQSFMATFPQYSSNGFHFGSESYGGHYVPVFSKYITDQNEKGDAAHIDLRSILIGNGWFSPQLQVASYIDFAFDKPGTYNLKPLPSTTRDEVHSLYYGKGQCLDKLKNCEATALNTVCRSTDHFCLDKIEQPFRDMAKRDMNDVREIDPSPFPNEFYADYLQLSHVREAIGARQTYIELNPTAGDAFGLTGDDARELGILNILKELVDQGVRVTLFAGDADYECNWFGVEAVANAIEISGYDQAGYTDVLTPDNVIHGQVKQSGGFSFMRVYRGGHALGAFQPLLQQTIFVRTVASMDIATGTVQIDEEYRSVGSKESRLVEGAGTVQDHAWPSESTYNYTSNLPTLEDFQPVQPGGK